MAEVKAEANSALPVGHLSVSVCPRGTTTLKRLALALALCALFPAVGRDTHFLLVLARATVM